MIKGVTRRQLLNKTVTIAGGIAAQMLLPAWARSGHNANLSGPSNLHGPQIDLRVEQTSLQVAGRAGRGILVNGQLPAPLIRWREGDEVTIKVTNALEQQTSIHWHGLLLPYQMDGVPGVSFGGINPGQTFTYRFPIRQAGTYWYHSHSGLQEQQGHYGPIIIEPREPDVVAYDREYVVVLSDWTFEDPHRLFAKLKKVSHVYNRQHRTVGDFFADAKAKGLKTAFADRAMWGRMRMNPTDIADVTAATYTYLLNGHAPDENWQGLFQPGETVRLRFINASAMTIFNIRIPELPMTMVQADGLDIEPVETDEFQIGVAETFDAVVKPLDRAYTIFAESNDRGGYARGTLTPRLGAEAAIPQLRQRPLLSMRDMAMAHGRHQAEVHDTHYAHHSSHTIRNLEPAQRHDHPKGPGVVGLAERPSNRLNERPLGLEDVPHRVLVYGDLKSLRVNPDLRKPERALELHLTSNMERYMWSFDGLKMSEVREPIVFNYGERLRLTMVNDTMMPHPIHLHGMFFELVLQSQVDSKNPRKHTVVVKPGEKMAIDITADALGDWAFHCHLLYHMHAGMMRVVSVRQT